ncbi:hypothetical protein GGR61_000163 [Xanthomonas arboricola]|nr:hypothetical protein [Xanthomonas sp. 3058]
MQLPAEASGNIDLSGLGGVPWFFTFPSSIISLGVAAFPGVDINGTTLAWSTGGQNGSPIIYGVW